MTDQFIVRAWVVSMPQPIDYGPMSAENAQQLEDQLTRGRKPIRRPVSLGGRMTIMREHVVAAAVLPIPPDATIEMKATGEPCINVSPPQEGHDSPQA